LAFKRLFIFLCVLPLFTFASAQSSSSDFPPEQLLQQIRPEAIRAHMEFLADDLLEGRGTGTRGYQLAANYVRSQFEEMGLKPAGVDGSYFQNIHFRKIDLLRDQSSLTIRREGAEQTLVMGKDYVMVGDPLRDDTNADAQVVFAGFGVTAPKFNYDDYAGVDVHGKIVAALYGAPASFPSAPGAHYSDSTVKLRNAAAHGAIGLLIIWGGKVEERTPFSQLVRFYRQPGLRWLDAKGVPNDAEPNIRAYARVSSDVARAMLEGSGKSWKQVLAVASDSKPQAFPLAVTASIHVVSRYSEVESPNIAAILPGSDPALKNEYVVFTAHTDHLGIGDPVNGDTIYNGAGDNASGTAALIEIARTFTRMPQAPRRSLLFLAVTGEEEGLLGSDYYAHYPTVPISQIVADVNMDEISFLYDFRDIVPLGGEHSSLGAVADDVARHMGLEVSPDPAPEEVFFVRSDQYSFVEQGVPALYIEEGYETVDPKLDGKKMQIDWENTRYHQPSDDMAQPFDFNALVKATRIDFAAGYEIAQQTKRPHWNKGDFFDQFAKPGVK
jgi:Zn-dependent M28 family amino/carboxypeptidase